MNSNACLKLASSHPQPGTPKIGVLLVNLGTPDLPSPESVRCYLAEFLSDPRVIELHPLLWKPILYGFILPARCKRVAEAYAKIWRKDPEDSPLRYFTRRQAELLDRKLTDGGHPIRVDWAMRYGKPSIPETLNTMRDQGCRRILVAPLYPQYSATTTATVIDKVFEALGSLRFQPALRTLPPYYDDPHYINALVRSLEKAFTRLSSRPEVIIASFHGLPRNYVEAGDPYFCHCAKTTRLLRERLGIDENGLRMAFQSRFGPKEWLRPYTDEMLADLAQSGVRRIAVLAPGFAADCLETLEEIGIRYRELFLARGGLEFHFIPCLNESEEGSSMLGALIERELRGWI